MSTIATIGRLTIDLCETTRGDGWYVMLRSPAADRSLRAWPSRDEAAYEAQCIADVMRSAFPDPDRTQPLHTLTLTGNADELKRALDAVC